MRETTQDKAIQLEMVSHLENPQGMSSPFLDHGVEEAQPKQKAFPLWGPLNSLFFLSLQDTRHLLRDSVNVG